MCAGLEHIHSLTTHARQQLRVDLGDFQDNTVYAEYDNFQVGSENEQYKLFSTGKYTGTAGQSSRFQSATAVATIFIRRGISPFLLPCPFLLLPSPPLYLPVPLDPFPTTQLIKVSEGAL